LNFIKKIGMRGLPLWRISASGPMNKIKINSYMDLTPIKYEYKNIFKKQKRMFNEIHYQGRWDPFEKKEISFNNLVFELGASKLIFSGDILYNELVTKINYKVESNDLVWSELEKVFSNYNKFIIMKAIKSEGGIEFDKIKTEGENLKRGNLKLILEEGVIKRSGILTEVFSIFNRILNLKFKDISKEGLLYKTITTDILLNDNIIKTSNLFMDSTDLNLAGTGSLNLKDKTIDITLAVQPLQLPSLLNDLISKLPIVGWVLTGKNKKILAAYFKVKGDIKNPTVESSQLQSIPRDIGGILLRTLKLPIDIVNSPDDVLGTKLKVR
ncbi:MAG: AsmA-like C-terminal domain-containing protein, partial [bacterium]